MARTWIHAAALAVGVAALSPASVAIAAEPVLGSPEYVANGEGFGAPAPGLISNGGVPSGVVTSVTWSGWGGAVARGTGRFAIYRPQGGYYPRVRGQLRAQDLGTCPGRPERAYTTLLFRVPPWPGGPLGPWLKWSGSRTTCSFDDTDPDYAHPARPAGVCGSVGDDDPGDVFDIQTYRMSCQRARQVARHVGRRDWPSRCAESGCTARIRRMRCRLERLHADELARSTDRRPVQRLACRRGKGTMSAWLVLAGRRG
jgi:hypothetical protein